MPVSLPLIRRLERLPDGWPASASRLTVFRRGRSKWRVQPSPAGPPTSRGSRGQASEEVGEIGVHHPPRSGVHFLTDDLQRVESRPLGPEPERTRQEAGLEERLSCPQHLRKIEVRSRAGASLFAMENHL